MPLITLLALAIPQQPASKPPEPSPAPIHVTLEAKAPSTTERMTWSPKGAKVDLHRQDGAMVGSFPLGPAGSKPIQVRLERSPGAAHCDVLAIDLDRDGTFGESERMTTTPKEQRGKWWSSFDTTVPVAFATKGSDKVTTVPYAMSLWFVEDPQEPTAPPQLRWSRRGWFEGKAQIGEQTVFVLVSEMTLDGVIDKSDSWALAKDHKLLLSSGPRELSGHCWLEDKAFRATAIAETGLSLDLVPFDPSTTEAEEKARADFYKADREAKRATTPIAFSTDFAKAMAQAAKDKKRVFVDFQTTWCGPCKLMDQWVYTAADVVAATQDIVCVKLDGDAERALVKRFGITAYPSMLLLEADGTEVRREVAYQGVSAMVKFLAK